MKEETEADEFADNSITEEELRHGFDIFDRALTQIAG